MNVVNNFFKDRCFSDEDGLRPMKGELEKGFIERDVLGLNAGLSLVTDQEVDEHGAEHGDNQPEGLFFYENFEKKTEEENEKIFLKGIIVGVKVSLLKSSMEIGIGQSVFSDLAFQDENFIKSVLEGIENKGDFEFENSKAQKALTIEDLVKLGKRE
jgi:hypothetical protein